MSQKRILNLLKKLYGDSQGTLAHEKINGLIINFPKKSEKYQESFSSADIVLITYGDSIKSKSKDSPLKTLHSFCNNHLKNIVSTIHILPFFPYSSDDGFSVKDFHAVDEHLGTWEDIQALNSDFELMFDFVLNHISAQSEWFRKYLDGDDEFKDLAIETDPNLDLSLVTRPRSLPLLTPVKKKSGEEVHVWTTFSADQVDVNFASVTILLKMVEILLHYVAMGATILRLDAIAFLWKEIGTTCLHLENTHNMVKLFRLILDEVAPDVKILTETNVPHPENISYFGDGKNEAQMVYNFTLPPLLLHSFLKKDTSLFSEWVSTLKLESRENAFFNFTASHDGIGVRPLEGILDKADLDEIIKMVKANGGQVSYKRNTDGSESPYELNITYVDAYLRGERGSDPYQASRFLASQAIQLVLPGVPAVYIHSLLGTHNWKEGVEQTKRARTINRRKLLIEELEEELADKSSFRSQIFYPYCELIRNRIQQPAFHPKADFNVLNIEPRLFCVERKNEQQKIICLTNVTDQEIAISRKNEDLIHCNYDILRGKTLEGDQLTFKPYQSCWLTVNPQTA
ncbi:MAG: sugar phosphorylase [Proteobacteria bacterium]|nr:sugar phosphorylase [Pseudomonadota bacterium]